MKTELTEQDKVVMEEVKEYWLNKFYSCPKLIEDEAVKAVNWLYTLAELKLPEVIFSKSPDDAQRIARERTGEDTFFYMALKGGVYDYFWVAFYDFFTRIGVVNHEKFNEYLECFKANIYSSIQLDEICVVIPMPEWILVDEEKKLHSTEKAAIQWEDGYKQYYIHGIYFGEELWNKVNQKTITFSEILGIENMEQRMILLKIYGPENILEQADSKLLDTSIRGNELYMVKGITSNVEYALKYSCPSTGRVYVDFVTPEVGVEANADIAMAWKLGITPEQYGCLRKENEA